MEHSEEDKGVAVVLLQRLVHERLPRLQDMKRRVDNGELLGDFDISYLQGALRDANQNRLRAMQFPEYAGIVEKLAELYEQIISRALENEQAQK